MMHVLAFGAQSLATGGEDVYVRSVAEDRLGETRSAPDEMLAAIEDKERSLLTKGFEDEREFPLCDRGETQVRGEHAGKQPRICEGRKVEEVNGSPKFGEQAVSQRVSDGRFAYTARTDNRYEAVSLQLGDELSKSMIAPYHQ
jgi:hypothetical protein